MLSRESSGFFFVLCAILILFLVSTAPAQVTINVPADQSTIQAGINAASNGDTVLVAPGTYVENINFMGKAITVTSSGGAAVTIIDGNQAGSVVTFSSGESASAVLDGFTIQSGQAQFDGGGILVQNSSPIIVNNIITDNLACSGGGGIAIDFGSPLIRENVISNNSQSGCTGGIGGGGISVGGAASAQILDNVITGNAWLSGPGGGISLFAAGTPTIRGNVISNNLATGTTPGPLGGGISLFNTSDALIVQNLIVGNTASSGGGVGWLVPSGARGPRLVNNTIANNNAIDGSAIFADGFDVQTTLVNNLLVGMAGQVAVSCGNFNDLNPPVFNSNNVFSDQAAAYGGICTDQTGSNGNISAQPLFVDPANDDFHLQLGSPGIDGGDSSAPDLPATDIDGDPRVLDGGNDCMARVDMGADEVVAGLASVSPSTLGFGSQLVTTTSGNMAVTLMNPGTTPLTVCNITASGSFAQTNNNCGGSLAAGGSCQVNVTFTPSATGASSGTLTITDSANGSPHTAALTGTGVDFGLSASPGSAMVSAGDSANYTVTVSAVGGTVSQMVTLACSGLPAGLSCSFNPAAVAPGATSATSMLTVSTSGLAVLAGPPLQKHSVPAYALWLPLGTVVLVGMAVAGRGRARYAAGAWLLLLVLVPISCNNEAPEPQTFAITISGTVGSVQHSTTTMLTVQ